MTTSARPFSRSSSGSVSSSDRVDDDARRPVEGADEVLAAGDVDRGLAADRRVDLPHQASSAPPSRRCRACTSPPRSPPTSVVVPPPSATTAPSRPTVNAPPEPLEHGHRLRRLARRDLVHGDVSALERDLGADAVDAVDASVRDELDRTGAGHEVAEEVDRAALDVDAGGGEQHAVAVARPRVGDGVVHRPALAVEAVEGLLVLREGPRAGADALPRLARVDLEEHGEGPRGRARPVCARTAPRRRRGRRRRGSCRRGPSATSSSSARKPRLAATREELRDRRRRRARSISWSRSTKRRPMRSATARPTVVFPAPMNPAIAR